jgi:hypothetical protein
VNWRNFIWIGLFILGNSVGYSQNDDFGVWAGFKVSKKWDKNWGVFMETQTRFNQNATDLKSVFIQGGINYKFTKWYKLGFAYRFTNFGEISTNRIDLDNEFKHKWKKNTFEIRFKYQKTLVANDLKGNRFRIRFKYIYKINKKFKPYVKAQYFYTQAYDFKGWHQQRYSLGILIKLKKRNYLDVFYNYDFEYNVKRPDRRFVFGVKYKLELK